MTLFIMTKCNRYSECTEFTAFQIRIETPGKTVAQRNVQAE